MKRIILALALSSTSALAQPAQEEIDRVLQASARDWSRGDLRAFMQSYEVGPGTAFVAGGGLITGFEAIQAHYAKRYGAGAGMGALTLKVLEYRPLTPVFVLVTGRFALARPAPAGGNAGGVFTLLFHRGPGGWRIAYDHTS
jgi:ketosteroid isomerase-like protein